MQRLTPGLKRFCRAKLVEVTETGRKSKDVSHSLNMTNCTTCHSEAQSAEESQESAKQLLARIIDAPNLPNYTDVSHSLNMTNCTDVSNMTNCIEAFNMTNCIEVSLSMACHFVKTSVLCVKKTFRLAIKKTF